MKRVSPKCLSAVAACFLLETAAHASLIVNGGFETGDFTGWTLSGNSTFSTVSSSSSRIHSGSYAAELGPALTLGFLSQTIATTPGQSYNLEFWLQTDAYSTDPSDEQVFQVMWNGVVINAGFDADAGTTPDDIGYYKYSYNVVATGTSTELELFGFRNDNDYFGLDDIQLSSVPEPSTFAVGAMLAIPVVFRWWRGRQGVAA